MAENRSKSILWCNMRWCQIEAGKKLKLPKTFQQTAGDVASLLTFSVFCFTPLCRLMRSNWRVNKTNCCDHLRLFNNKLNTKKIQSSVVEELKRCRAHKKLKWNEKKLSLAFRGLFMLRVDSARLSQTSNSRAEHYRTKTNIVWILQLSAGMKWLGTHKQAQKPRIK